MNNNRKKLLITIGVLLAITLLIGASYAYYIFAISQSGSNIVNTDCFRVTFTDGNAINIGDGIPLTDEEAEELTPYTFTIKNVCNQNMDYNVNIETLNNTTMDLDAIKYQLFNDDFDDIDNLGNIPNNDSSIFINQNVTSSKTLESDYLMPNQEVTFNLRLWIDEDATYEQSANKELNTKIVISSILRYADVPGAILAKGPVVNARLKGLLGIEPQEMTFELACPYDGVLYSYFQFECNRFALPVLGKLDNWDYYINKKIYSEEIYRYVGKIILSDEPPGNNVETVVISSEDSPNEILAWLEDLGNNVYNYKIYSPSKIYLNRDSSFIFSGINSLEEIDFDNYDFSLVENAEGMFANMDYIDIDFGENLDSHRLKKIKGMFVNTIAGSVKNIDKLDTSNIKNMSHLFDESNVPSLIDLGDLDTSKVTDMSYMFANANTPIDLSHLNTSNVQNFEGMFAYNTLSTIDVSNLDTSNATNMRAMFARLTDVYGVEHNALITIVGLNTFNTSNVTDMSYMFSGNQKINGINFNGLDTSKVTNMSHMFYDLYYVTSLDVSSLNTSNVTDMSYMFALANRLTSLDVTNFNTSKVTNMSHMFYGLGTITSLLLRNFNTSNVTDMSYMFSESTEINSLDLYNFDTSKVTNMENMFSIMDNIITIEASNNWKTTKVTKSTDMFNASTKLVGGEGTVYNDSHIDAEYARVDDPTNGKPGYFTLKTN